MWFLAVAAALAAEPIGSPFEGWQITPPDGWKSMEQGGAWLLGHDSEAGLLIVSYAPGATLDQATAQSAQGVNEQGLSLMPKAPPGPFEAKGGAGVAVDLAGRAADGAAIEARAIAVVGATGAVVVMGLTTAEQMPALAMRVDAMAGSVAFFTPQTSDLSALKGTICAWSGGSSFSSTSRMTFDGAGRVGWGSELVGGGSFTDGTGAQTGSWSAMSGNQNATTDVGAYTIQGDALRIRWGDGSTKECAVHHRVSGRITELKCGDQLWGSGLCG